MNGHFTGFRQFAEKLVCVCVCVACFLISAVAISVKVEHRDMHH